MDNPGGGGGTGGGGGSVGAAKLNTDVKPKKIVE